MACNKKPFQMTDDEIKKEISVPGIHTTEKFDVASLFAIVTNILKPATIAADNVIRVYVYVTTLHTLFNKNFLYYYLFFFLNLLLLFLLFYLYKCYLLLLVWRLGYTIVVTLPLINNLLDLVLLKSNRDEYKNLKCFLKIINHMCFSSSHFGFKNGKKKEMQIK